MSWLLLIFSFIMALFLTFNTKIKMIIATQFAILFYYVSLLAFINIIAKSFLLNFAILFTGIYIINLIANMVRIHQKSFDMIDDKNVKIFARTMLQFSLSLILILIIIIILLIQ